MPGAISYGGGVQSSALVALAAVGELPYQDALFANVGDDSEHPQTLRYVREVMTPWAAARGVEVVELRRHRRTGAVETLHERLTRDGSRSVPIPVRMDNGTPGTRSCTADFKIRVIGKWLKARGATAADALRQTLARGHWRGTTRARLRHGAGRDMRRRVLLDVIARTHRRPDAGLESHPAVSIGVPTLTEGAAMLRPVESPDNDDFLQPANEAQRRRDRLASSIALIADLLSDLRGLAFADCLDLVAVHRDDTVTLKRALITKRTERPPAALDYLARRIVAILLEPHHGSSVDDVLAAYREVTR